MVDPHRVRELLDHIEEETGHLLRLRALGAQVLDDPDRLRAAKYGFVVAIEAAIDVGQHIISSEALEAVDSFADIFEVLGKHGFVPVDLAPRLMEMARFRNLLVHQYLKVDDARVLEVLQTSLEDLDAFRRAIAGAIAGDG